MYEAVHVRPDREANERADGNEPGNTDGSTVARIALTASEYGFEGIVVRNHGDSPASYDREVGSE